MPQQPAAPAVGVEVHPPEPGAVDAGNAVVLGEALVQERVVGPQQVEHAAVLVDHAPDEPLRLLPHRLPQVVVEIGEEAAVRAQRREVAQPQPLPREVAGEVERARVGEHPARLPLELGGVAQLAAYRRVEQLVVGQAAPEEERQPRRQLQVADVVRGDGPAAVGIELDPEQELRVDENRAQRAAYAGVEVAARPALPVERHRAVEVRVRHRPPIGPPHQRGEDLPRAAFLLARLRRPAHEQPLAARRVAHPLRGVGPGDRHLVDGRGQPGVPGLVEVRLPGPALGLHQRRGALQERDAEVVGAGGHRGAHLQVAVDQRVVPALRPLDREARDGDAVEQDLHLVRPPVAEAADVAGAIPRQPHLDVVVAVLGERVGNDDAAAGAQGQPRHVLLLSGVRGHADHVGLQ